MKESKSSYREKLLDPRWQKKRLLVLERDEWKCTECGSEEKTLHVHHSYYNDEAEGPWDYSIYTMMTLCDDCHKAEQEELRHARGYIITFLAEAGITSAVDMQRAATLLNPHGILFSKKELYETLNIIELVMISRAVQNDGGDLWRNFCSLLDPYSAYPNKRVRT